MYLTLLGVAPLPRYLKQVRMVLVHQPRFESRSQTALKVALKI